MAGISSSAGLGGTGRTQNGAARASQGPVPVNPHPASGVRTPTDIMRQRRDREARKKAEQEARNREQEEAERRRQEAQDKSQAQAYTAAGVAGDRTSQGRTAAPRAVPGAENKSDIRGTSSATQQPPGHSPATRRPPAPPQAPGGQSQQTSAPQQQQPLQGAPGLSKPQPHSSHPGQPGAPPSQQQVRRVAFPHAFERWETLSSHWEGLTGYWIRKLEQNNEALERDPISQQMARQVTDLSAAGANLFHAVVELQRLRASSERKFQRWFFDTRSEQERAKEVQAELERQLRTERQARSEALAASQKAENDKIRAEDLLRDMRRELQISKDEARRAWEELGRREQEERERTNSLRNGEPTLVGGVQVVPMIQGLPSRQNPSNRPPTRESPYAGGEGNGKPGGLTSEGQYYDETPSSPTETDPFTEGRRAHQESDVQRLGPPQPPTTTAEATGHYTSHYFDQGGAYPAGPTAENDDRSYVGSSEPGEEEYGTYRRNPQGRPIVYPKAMSEDSDEYEQGSMDGSEGAYVPTSMPPSSGPSYAGYGQGSVDYSGSGWGVGSGWESVTPRHRHPTRLSDVLEEEEPRTTPSRASRASQASRSVH
ncbi:hypothetical protein EYZ11_008757 [Aspergillus tanneri]|nr:hypothetical protein EYZ11_008757 [Aspergillus tanneri]